MKDVNKTKVKIFRRKENFPKKRKEKKREEMGNLNKLIIECKLKSEFIQQLNIQMDRLDWEVKNVDKLISCNFNMLTIVVEVASTWTPWFNNIRTNASCPDCAAKCKGVNPYYEKKRKKWKFILKIKYNISTFKNEI